MKRLISVLITVAVVLAVLVGCSDSDLFSEPTYNIERKTFVMQIEFDESLQYDGLAEWRDGYCKITLKQYPRCLAHEVRHCIEGHWHDERPNGEDCY